MEKITDSESVPDDIKAHFFPKFHEIHPHNDFIASLHQAGGGISSHLYKNDVVDENIKN